MDSENIENPRSNGSQKANIEEKATHSINEFSFDILDRDLLRCEDFCEHLQIFTNYKSCSTLEVNYDFEDGQILVAGKNNRNIAKTSMAGSDDENVRFLASFRASNGWGIISADWQVMGDSLIAISLNGSDLGVCNQLVNMDIEEAMVNFISNLKQDGLVAYSAAMYGPLMDGIDTNLKIEFPSFDFSIIFDPEWPIVDLRAEKDYAYLKRDYLADIEVRINKEMFIGFNEDKLPKIIGNFIRDLKDKNSSLYLHYLEMMSKYEINSEEVKLFYSDALVDLLINKYQVTEKAIETMRALRSEWIGDLESLVKASIRLTEIPGQRVE